MTKVILFTPFVLQALSMFIDELYFHRKRGLGLWERIGHPLDTITVLICFLFLVVMPYSETNLLIYTGLAFFSSLFVTKDEFVHAKLCEPAENWLHAVLFILHPICFVSAALLWKGNENANFLIAQSVVLAVVLVYQIFYWSFIWKKT
jgi:hypothetical protein